LTHAKWTYLISPDPKFFNAGEKFMFDEDLPKKKSSEFPRNLENLSVEELKAYIDDLRREIKHVEEDIKTKEKSQAAADSFFKL